MRLLPLLLAAITLTGCVEFLDHRLPEVADSLVRSKVESVDYSLVVRWEGVLAPEQVGIYSIILETPMHHLFTKVQRGGTSAPLNLHFVLSTPTIAPGEYAYWNLAALTAFVIPLRREILYQLDVQASWNGSPFRNYHYEDSKVLWVELLLLPVWPFGPSPTKTQLDIIRNMELTFLIDLSKDLEALDVSH